MSNPYRTADTPETIPAQNSSKFPLDIEASVNVPRGTPVPHEMPLKT